MYKYRNIFLIIVLLAQQFLDNNSSQLTVHGLHSLSEHLKLDSLYILFRNNHFSTLYKNEKGLFTLVTDQGYVKDRHVVWETLSTVDGDSVYVGSSFTQHKEQTEYKTSKSITNLSEELARHLQHKEERAFRKSQEELREKEKSDKKIKKQMSLKRKEDMVNDKCIIL